MKTPVMNRFVAGYFFFPSNISKSFVNKIEELRPQTIQTATKQHSGTPKSPPSLPSHLDVFTL